MDSTPATVDVVLITYNHSRFITQALDGALAQRTTFPVRIILGDDASTDGTQSIIRTYIDKYPDRIDPILNSQNIGVFSPDRLINKMYERCTAPYIAILEGDDYWTDPLKLQRQVDFLQSNPNYSGCGHRVTAVDPDGQNLLDANGQPIPPYPESPRDSYTLNDLYHGNIMHTCSAVIRRSTIAPLPSWYLTVIPGDWTLYMLAARHGPFRVLPEVMGAYRIHSGGFWHLHNKYARAEQELDLIRNTILRHFDSEYREQIARVIPDFRMRLFYAYLSDNRFTHAARELSRLVLDPICRPHIPWRQYAGAWAWLLRKAILRRR